MSPVAHWNEKKIELKAKIFREINQTIYPPCPPNDAHTSDREKHQSSTDSQGKNLKNQLSSPTNCTLFYTSVNHSELPAANWRSRKISLNN